jgi:hypothetical protein
MVGMRGFGPPTSRSRTERANRTALHPDFFVHIMLYRSNVKILLLKLLLLLEFKQLREIPSR